MQKYQHDFIAFAINKEVLRFGEFTLKSGRKSPYFFNSGLFNDGESLYRLAEYYADAIEHAGIEFDMIFGPAYKGIPLAAAVAIAYSRKYKRNFPYSFNRKEEKDHGEGGIILGAELSGKVLIVDDVITAGNSVNLSVEIINKAGAKAVAVAIALDRQETGKNKISAIEEAEQSHNLSVISIIKLENLMEYLKNIPEHAEHLGNIKRYIQEYGINRA